MKKVELLAPVQDSLTFKAAIENGADAIYLGAKKFSARAYATNFELDEIQANAILEMRLSKLTSLEVEKLNEELKELESQIADYKDILEKTCQSSSNCS